MPNTMIILRTKAIDGALSRFADDLAEWSGSPVVFVADARHSPVTDPARRDVIGLTKASCAQLGLYCPPDFAWRCGDYGLYLARQRYPSVEHFWLIEDDVRLIGRGPSAFFEAFAADGSDLIASYIEPAPANWYWTRALVSRGRPVFKCFFPVVRITARALDRMLDDRRRHSRQFARRYFWANDEGFVATSVVGEGSWREINGPNETFYDADTFSFDSVLDGRSMPPVTHEARLMHPVLTGQALRDKQARLRARQAPGTRLGRLTRRLWQALGPDAIISAWNARHPW